MFLGTDHMSLLHSYCVVFIILKEVGEASKALGILMFTNPQCRQRMKRQTLVFEYIKQKQHTKEARVRRENQSHTALIKSVEGQGPPASVGISE